MILFAYKQPFLLEKGLTEAHQRYSIPIYSSAIVSFGSYIEAQRYLFRKLQSPKDLMRGCNTAISVPPFYHNPYLRLGDPYIILSGVSPEYGITMSSSFPHGIVDGKQAQQST